MGRVISRKAHYDFRKVCVARHTNRTVLDMLVSVFAGQMCDEVVFRLFRLVFLLLSSL